MFYYFHISKGKTNFPPFPSQKYLWKCFFPAFAAFPLIYTAVNTALDVYVVGGVA